MNSDEKLAAAIALAIGLYTSEVVHDVESGVITFRKQDSQWSNKMLSMRKIPKK